MSLPDLLGYTAAFLTTSAFVPQVVQTLRTRDTRAISLGMYLLFSAGVALWALYGVLLKAWPIIFANGVTLLLTLVVLGYKLTESRRARGSQFR
jgi:MtN3 and saliva related transmembrane protein